MKLSEIMEKIEKRMPKRWAEEWDNPGLQAGSADSNVRKIALALDASDAAVHEAAAAGCQLLFTHHPILFRPIRSVTDENYAGRAVTAAIREGVAIYAAHTNWDSSPEGVNFTLASLLCLKNLSPLAPSAGGAWGMGAVGDFDAPVDLKKLAALLKERWRLSNFTLYGDPRREIKRAAIGGGACQEFWREAKALGADVFITADLSYHFREEAASAGLLLAACDHGEMERASLASLRGIIENETGLPVVLLNEPGIPFFHG